MKFLASALSLVAMLAATSVVSADHHVPAPVPEMASGELFHCVKVKDSHHIAPCAVPRIVEIVDPCWKPDPCNPCCKPKCVKVSICGPKPACCSPCDCCCKDNGPKITCSKDGKVKRYDYGKYAVDIVSKNGVVSIDYDD